MDESEDDQTTRTIRLVLRRPSAVNQAEDLIANPQTFDKIFTKPYYAHQLKLAGHDWPVIARKLGYKDQYTAERAVHRWLTKTVEKGKLPNTRAALQAEAVKLDLDRLDKLMSSYWEEAVAGDLPSAHFVLRVIAQRARYIAPEPGATAVINNQHNTLVVGGTESEYIGSLLKARESLGPAHRVIEAADDQSNVVDLEPSRE